MYFFLIFNYKYKNKQLFIKVLLITFIKAGNYYKKECIILIKIVKC